MAAFKPNLIFSKQAATDLYNPFVISYSKRSAELENKFTEYNKIYFQNRLPRYHVFLCSKPKRFGHRIAGYCLTGKKMILIRNGLGWRSTNQTLLHEMVHIQLNDPVQIERGSEHGEPFRKEIKRLRKARAPISPLDIDRQPDLKVSLRKRMEALVNEALFKEHLEKENVPRFLELEMDLPLSVISRVLTVKEAIENIYSDQIRNRQPSSYSLPVVKSV